MIENVVGMVALGLAGGALTTVSGMGGGLVVVFVLSWALGPKAALVVSAAALLIGNLHRVWLYRDEVDRAVVARLLLGLIPGTLLGAWLAGGLSDDVIRMIMVVAAGAAVLRAATGTRWTLPPAALAPSGAAVGVLAATAGGAAALLGPVLLSSGLSGRRYLAVTGIAATAMHTVRVSGYGAFGLWDAAYLPLIAILALALLGGNLLGNAVRERIPPRTGAALELLTPVVCAALAVAGLG